MVNVKNLPGNQDPAPTSTIPQLDYSDLSIDQLEHVLKVDAGLLSQARNDWRRLHDVLAGFLGKPANGQEDINFPKLVDSLSGWKGAAADEFRKYAKAIVDLAQGMSQVAASEGQAATFDLLTDDVHQTLTSAQQNVFQPLHANYPRWKHTLYSILTDADYWRGGGAYSTAPPGVNKVRTDAGGNYNGDVVTFAFVSRQGTTFRFDFDYATSRFSAYEPYWVRGTLLIGGAATRGGVFPSGYITSAEVHAMDPKTGHARGESFGPASPGSIGKDLGGVGSFDGLYHDQLVTLAGAVGYLYTYRRRDLPKVPEYVPPGGGSDNGGGGGGGGGGAGGGAFPPGPLSPSPFGDGNGLAGPNAFSGDGQGLPGYDPTASGSGLPGTDGYDPGLGGSGLDSGYDPYGSLAEAGPGLGGSGLFTPGAGSGLGDGLGAGALGAGGLGAGGGLGGGLGAGALAGEGAGLAGAAGRAGMPMSPGMGAGSGGKENKERQRQSWLPEEDDIWGADTDAPGPVL